MSSDEAKNMTGIPRETVDKIASSLSVVSKSDHGAWRIWTVRGGQIFDTWVVQGPESVVVTGDAASAVFERSGGLSLGFVDTSLGYAAQKCRAGSVYKYDGETAREELNKALTEKLEEAREEEDEQRVNTIEEYQDEADGLDFSDEREVNTWYYDGPGSGGDYPNFGQVYSESFLRACACIRTVCLHETKYNVP